jgi:hypothetical protein
MTLFEVQSATCLLERPKAQLVDDQGYYQSADYSSQGLHSERPQAKQLMSQGPAGTEAGVVLQQQWARPYDGVVADMGSQIAAVPVEALHGQQALI